MIHLIDSDPSWFVAHYRRNGTEYHPSGGDPAFPNGRHGMGVTFICPVHGDGCYLGVSFANPIDGGPPDHRPGRSLWQRTGDTFETLTLTPSVHVLDPGEVTHWHGFITAGRIEGGY